jgi:hypothetical protein
MKITSRIIICSIALLISFLISGCNLCRQNDENSNMSYNKLIHELESQGYTIDEIELTENDTKHSFFSVFPKYVDINEHRIYIYEFPDTSTADSQADTISNDGFSIGNAMIDWIDKPHFYKQGKLIVSYIGSDNEILGNLKKILGEPVTK